MRELRTKKLKSKEQKKEIKTAKKEQPPHTNTPTAACERLCICVNVRLCAVRGFCFARTFIVVLFNLTVPRSSVESARASTPVQGAAPVPDSRFAPKLIEICS